LQYSSDLTDEEWRLVEALIPPAKRGGRKREVDVRAVINGVMYVLSTGCQWRSLPKDFPPKSTVWAYLKLWSYDGALDHIHGELYARREDQAKGKKSIADNRVRRRPKPERPEQVSYP
jgi:transposase